MNSGKTCFFLGEEEVDLRKRDIFQYCLAQEMEKQLLSGKNLFLVGDVTGFAAMVLLTSFFFRRFYPQLIIKAVWPYRGYLPPDVDDATLRYCIEQVNQMQYAAEEYGSGCVAKRNCYLLESNSYGIVYSPLSHGPVAQTLANACCRGVPACNLAKWLD